MLYLFTIPQLLGLFLGGVYGDGGAGYTYDLNDTVSGPYYWGALYPQCNGSYQSPIDIDVVICDWDSNNGASVDLKLAAKVPTNVTLANDGYSVTWEFEYSGERPYLLNNGSKYVFANMHMHWGQANGAGSEHMINGQSADMEIHLIHRKETYSSVAEAAGNRDGLVVVGVLYSVPDRRGGSGPGIPNRPTPPKAFLSRVPSVTLPNTAASATPTTLSGYTIKSIVGPNDQPFVTYPGSLTTPTCNEAVTWVVLPIPRPVSPGDMTNVRALKKTGASGLVSMGPNYRPVQNGPNGLGEFECLGGPLGVYDNL